MVGFLGNYERRIDKKGRVLLPPPFRQELARDGFEGMHCYPSLDMNAVDAGGNGLLAEIDRHLGRYESFSEEHDYLSTAFFGVSQRLGIDPEGRITLTPQLLEYAGIAEDLVFVGQRYKFQIWEPGRFADYQAEARNRALALRKAGPRILPAAGGGQA